MIVYVCIMLLTGTYSEISIHCGRCFGMRAFLFIRKSAGDEQATHSRRWEKENAPRRSLCPSVWAPVGPPRSALALACDLHTNTIIHTYSFSAPPLFLSRAPAAPVMRWQPEREYIHYGNCACSRFIIFSLRESAAVDNSKRSFLCVCSANLNLLPFRLVSAHSLRRYMHTKHAEAHEGSRLRG
jgi:hypothetical protein